MDAVIINALNGLCAGLLLFMLSAGLTLIFSLMGVLNFAHAGFYLLGAYLGHSLTQSLGFWVALVLAPLAVGALGAAFEGTVLRRVHRLGHVPELLVTFGLSYVIVEGVKLIWGLSSLPSALPPSLQGPAFTLVSTESAGLTVVWGAPPPVCQAPSPGGGGCAAFPAARLLAMAVSVGVLLALAGLLSRTRIGLVIQAARTHPQMTEALGHDVPRVHRRVFGGGCALAALAGVLGGALYVIEPGMAASVGSLVFVVVVVGGLGSLSGALAGSLAVGWLQTLPLSVDASLADALRVLGWAVSAQAPGGALLEIPLSQAAPLLPYLLLVLVLIVRPRGLLGTRAD